MLAAGANIDTFSNGSANLVIELREGELSDSGYFSLPAGCHVLSATMKVTVAEATGQYPAGPEVLLNDTVIWAFNGTGFGRFGHQDRFLDGTDRFTAGFGAGGGIRNATVRLPKGAQVVGAAADITVEGPRKVLELANLTGGAAGAKLGSSVAGVGDINNDGFGDFAVSSPGYAPGAPGQGCVLVYLGGASVDTVPDHVLKGAFGGGEVGVTLSGAGDVDGDGFDDVVFGYTYVSSGYTMIYYGGDPMGGDYDLIPAGYGPYASGAGDVNGDGLGDIIVGAPASGVGRAYLFFGGASSYSTPDVTLTGPASGDLFGAAVSSAGDVNADGYDDVIVGAYYDDAGGSDAGAAYVFFGGSSMDTEWDLALRGTGAYDWFGRSVSGAGDVNGDGYDDVVVGSEYDDTAGSYAGSASVFLGGRPPDSKPDVVLKGLNAGDMLGRPVSGAGDVDGDGIDDVIVGARYGDGDIPNTGSANVYRGGSPMDASCDVLLHGELELEKFGLAVDSAGDVNSDGCDEVLVGAPEYYSGGNMLGKAHLYSMPEGPRGSNVSMGGVSLWARPGYYHGTSAVIGFSSLLTSRLKSLPATGSDGFGNSFVDLPVSLSAATEGNLTLSNLSLVYRHNATVPDFSGPLNDYLAAHMSEQDGSGRIAVPVVVRGASPGHLKLHSLRIVCDCPPTIPEPLPDVEMDEDTIAPSLLDLYEYFEDDLDPVTSLSFSIEEVSPAGLVNVTVSEGRYISADALTGDLNDNWTGAVDVTVSCSDTRGLTTLSGRFRIVVRNVNDPPVFTSRPPATCTAGEQYSYFPAAVDGDGDGTKLSLLKGPAEMTLSASGEVRWIPVRRGEYAVLLEASDGSARTRQDYIITVPDQMPRMVSMPPKNATVGVPYEHRIIATDDDGDPLSFRLERGPPGMSVSPDGRLSWMPSGNGTFEISIAVEDGEMAAYLNYTLALNRPPRFVSRPALEATAGASYSYPGGAVDDDGDSLGYDLVTKPDGMTVDPSTGLVLWRPGRSQLGNHTVKLAASDGRGGVCEQSFVVTVRPVRPVCSILTPGNGSRAAGVVTVGGRVVPGTGTDVQVRLRVDGGPWQPVPGTENWTYLLDTRGLKNGLHTIEAQVFDGVSSSDAATLALQVDNPPKPGGDGSFLAVAVIGVLAIAGGLAAAYRIASKKRHHDR
ncbi:MAG: hypothetical protein FJ149_10990 [Euryarchaeota archaeon]|nr:hypothetical protein [Euryarchaeota archaeon]